MSELRPCPYCGNKAEYYPEDDGQASAIYCEECPLGVEESGASYPALAYVWNSLPRDDGLTIKDAYKVVAPNEE